MRVEIVAIGTELLLGLLVDTNSGYIAQQLADNGIDCHFQTRVGDNISRIKEALATALDRSDAVICCGGLGPTSDDVTREAIANLMGAELVFQQDIWESIEARLSVAGRSIASINKSQAMVPKGAVPILQLTGTAPGLICRVGEKAIYATPGVPAEMKEMMESTIMADLRRRREGDYVIISRTLRTWGLPESRIAELISGRIDTLDKLALGDDLQIASGQAEAMEPGNTLPGERERAAKSGSARLDVPTIAFLASSTEGVKIRIGIKSNDRGKALAAIEREEKAIREILGESIFASDDETMEEVVAKELVKHNLTLSVVESLTGGLVAARIVSIPGASQFFKGGLVAYATEIKKKFLGLEGPVVSEEAAVKMAEGARREFKSDIAISTTGVAGPDKQEDIEPGTVYVGIATAQKSVGYKLSLRGNRDRIRQSATMAALDILRKHVMSL